MTPEITFISAMLVTLQSALVTALIVVCLAIIAIPGALSKAVEIVNKNIWRATGGIAIAVYVSLIVAIAFVGIPGENSSLHYAATRYLPSNTRLSEILLSAPKPRTLADRYRLDRELARLSGKYIVQEVRKGGEVKAINTAGWPTLVDQDLASVEIAGAPDWMLFNSGTKVDIWAANKLQGASCVLAIVPSERGLPSDHASTAAAAGEPKADQGSAPARKWLVLLRRGDLGRDGLAIANEQLALRIREVPEPAAEPRCVDEAPPIADKAPPAPAGAATTTPALSSRLPNQK